MCAVTVNFRIESIGRGFQESLTLEDEMLRGSYPVKCHEEALHRRPMALCTAGCQRRDTQATERAREEASGRSDEGYQDSLLQFRDAWVRNRARDIRQAGRISFETCSEDTASIRALNEFYMLGVVDRFNAENCDNQESEPKAAEGLRYLGSSPKDLVVAERPHMCRSTCRERSSHVLKNACRKSARSRAI